MNKPSSKRPYIISLTGYSITFEDISNVDTNLIQSLLKAKEIDTQIHFIEWLEYDLYNAKKGLEKLESKNE